MQEHWDENGDNNAAQIETNIREQPDGDIATVEQGKRRNIGHLVRDLRESKRMSRSELANRCGVSNATISMIERGQRRPKDELCIKLAVALDADPQELALARLPILGRVETEEPFARDPRLKKLEQQLLYLRKTLPPREYSEILTSIMKLLSVGQNALAEDSGG